MQIQIFSYTGAQRIARMYKYSHTLVPMVLSDICGVMNMITNAIATH